MRFQYLKENKDRYNIRRACKTLGISASGYYEYLQRKPSKRSIENEFLSEKIKAIFEKNDGRYGCKRISISLEKEGIKVNHKKVARLMRNMGLFAKGSSRQYRRYHKKNLNQENPNLLEQSFKAETINKVWLGDITYIPTKEGFLYLAVFLDVFTRKITGFTMSSRINEDLAISAFLQAFGREQPEEGLVVHTDQGSQYTGKRFRATLKGKGAISSNSRKGNPYDNAMMESFYRTIKRELIKGKTYFTRDEAKTDIFKYIELYYNSERMHSSIGYVSPREFEKIHLNN